MAWTAYQVILRLCSPMHIGKGKVGNLQLTRPYVAGRNLWGALTARLARDRHPQGNPPPAAYGEMGQRVHDELAFSYFYPTTQEDGTVDQWPWDDGFRWRFLSTYPSTALDYDAISAAEASLHEVECILPHTRGVKGADTIRARTKPDLPSPSSPRTHHQESKPVYLTGYVFQRQDSDLNWQSAVKRLQMGGERGYGWGLVKPANVSGNLQPAGDAFAYELQLDGSRPVITLTEGSAVLAHTLAVGFEQGDGGRCLAAPEGSVEGRVEPLVGRETGPDTKFGVHLSHARISYVPGSRATQDLELQIGRLGLWEGTPDASSPQPL